MSIDERLSALAGKWKGTNRLNMSWMPDPIKESESKATVVTRVGGQCLEIAYIWEFEGQKHEGLLVMNGDPKSEEMSAFWTDSWHSANVLMPCKGEIGIDGKVVMMGHYSVPDHPDWGWRIEITPHDETFIYKMFNISPDGEEDWAVETIFSRA